MYALLKRLFYPVLIDICFKLVRLFGIFTSSHFYIATALKNTDCLAVIFKLSVRVVYDMHQNRV